MFRPSNFHSYHLMEGNVFYFSKAVLRTAASKVVVGGRAWQLWRKGIPFTADWILGGVLLPRPPVTWGLWGFDVSLSGWNFPSLKLFCLFGSHAEGNPVREKALTLVPLTRGLIPFCFVLCSFLLKYLRKCSISVILLIKNWKSWQSVMVPAFDSPLGINLRICNETSKNVQILTW